MRLFQKIRLGLIILALTLPSGIASADSTSTHVACWQRFPAPAEPRIAEVAHGGDDYPIQQLTSSGWVYVEGAGLTLSMDRDGRPWHTNSRGEAYFWGGCSFPRSL